MGDTDPGGDPAASSTPGSLLCCCCCLVATGASWGCPAPCCACCRCCCWTGCEVCSPAVRRAEGGGRRSARSPPPWVGDGHAAGCLPAASAAESAVSSSADWPDNTAEVPSPRPPNWAAAWARLTWLRGMRCERHRGPPHRQCVNTTLFWPPQAPLGTQWAGHDMTRTGLWA